MNQYLRSITPNNYPFQQKLFIKKRQPYKVCDNLHKRIERKLKDADGDFIEREEEYFKNQRRYNLRSLDLDEILFNIDDRYLVIEEEEREEETSAASASASAASADPPTTNPPPNRQSKPRKGSTVTSPN